MQPGGAAGFALLVEKASAAAEFSRVIPQRASVRVIVDNDFAGDPDGLVALAHQMLTPKAQVRLVTASALDPKMSAEHPHRGRTAAAGRDVAQELIKRAGIMKPPSVIAGPETLNAGQSEAASAIVALIPSSSENTLSRCPRNRQQLTLRSRSMDDAEMI